MNALRTPYPFAAASIACASLDHLGNARRRDDPKASDDHRALYTSFIAQYLGKEGFPDDCEMRTVFYASLRCGLLHNARTDDTTAKAELAQVVHLTHELQHPARTARGVLISVPWLCNAIEHQWKDTQQISEPAQRKVIADRLRMYVDKVILLDTPPPNINGPILTATSASATGIHSAYFIHTRTEADDAREAPWLSLRDDPIIQRRRRRR